MKCICFLCWILRALVQPWKWNRCYCMCFREFFRLCVQMADLEAKNTIWKLKACHFTCRIETWWLYFNSFLLFLFSFFKAVIRVLIQQGHITFIMFQTNYISNKCCFLTKNSEKHIQLGPYIFGHGHNFGSLCHQNIIKMKPDAIL